MLKIISPLWDAVMLDKNEALLELMIKNGADVDHHFTDIKDKLTLKKTLLQHIASSKDWQTLMKIAKILIHKGAIVNDFTRFKDPNEELFRRVDLRSPLNIAIMRGDSSCVEFFLENGAELDCSEIGMGQLSDMLFECKKQVKRKNVFLVLLKYGLDAKYEREQGENLLHFFIRAQRLRYYVNPDIANIVETLLDNAGVKILDGFDKRNKLPPLCQAIMMAGSGPRRHPSGLALVAMLIKKGADVRSKVNTWMGFSPLHFAITYKVQMAIVVHLLTHGADINATDDYGRTALHLLCYMQNFPEEAIDYFLQSGANLNAKDRDGITPIKFMFCLKEERMSRRREDQIDRCLMVIAKHIAKCKFLKIPVNNRNVTLVLNEMETRVHYDECVKELDNIGKVKSYCTFPYELLLKKDPRYLAVFMENKRLPLKFMEYLRSFPIYRAHMLNVYTNALRFRKKWDSVEPKVKAAFYGVLPDLVIRKIALYVAFQELPSL